MFRDLRYAIRQMQNSPSFALTVIATLALGIGANTAVFSVMNATLLRMLPVRQPGQLFYLAHANMPPSVGNIDDSRYTYGINVYNRLKQDHSAFSDVIAYAPLSEKQNSGHANISAGGCRQPDNGRPLSQGDFSDWSHGW